MSTRVSRVLLDPRGGRGARLYGNAPERPTGVVLVCHGGAEEGTAPVGPLRPSFLRMMLVARAIAHEAGPSVAVVRLRYRVSGWNGAAEDPLVDARWALERICAVYPGVPIALVGYSMGGRVVLRLADADGVAAVAALAPWIAGDAHQPPPGVPLLLMHGTADTVTDPRRTSRLARRFAAAGVDVRLTWVRGDSHPMMRRPRVWHRTVAQFVTKALRAASAP